MPVPLASCGHNDDLAQAALSGKSIVFEANNLRQAYSWLKYAGEAPICLINERVSLPSLIGHRDQRRGFGRPTTPYAPYEAYGPISPNAEYASPKY